MIREEFLICSAKSNLSMLRNVRDAAVILAAGYGVNGFNAFSAYERIRICTEINLRDAAEAGAGLLALNDAYLTDLTGQAENRAAALTGIPLSRDLTIRERKLLQKTTPPVGKLPQVYERLMCVTENALSVTGALGELISALYDNAASGKLQHAVPLSGIEALGKMTDDYNMLARELGRNIAKCAECDTRVLDKLIGVLIAQLDPYYENALKDLLLKAVAPETKRDALREYCAGVAKGAKTASLPLLGDLTYRYACLDLY